MTSAPPDLSRDRRIEDPTNLWIVHPAGRLLLPWAIQRGISANAVSLAGLVLGGLSALAYANSSLWPFAVAGLLLSVAWLIADGLDGMIARATGTASPLGRIFDGLCDHGVFLLLYVGLAASVGIAENWLLACSAGALHAVQANLFESERARFHRRCKGVARSAPAPSRNPLVRFYDFFAGFLDRAAGRFDELLARHPHPLRLAERYGAEAAKPLRLMSLLSANVRVVAIFTACLIGDPRLFWWFELVPLTAILLIGLIWHRAVEFRIIGENGGRRASTAAGTATTAHSKEIRK